MKTQNITATGVITSELERTDLDLYACQFFVSAGYKRGFTIYLVVPPNTNQAIVDLLCPNRVLEISGRPIDEFSVWIETACLDEAYGKQGSFTLIEVNGYTADFRLKEFRRIEHGELPEFIPFDSEKGKLLLAQFYDTVAPPEAWE